MSKLVTISVIAIALVDLAATWDALGQLLDNAAGVAPGRPGPELPLPPPPPRRAKRRGE